MTFWTCLCDDLPGLHPRRSRPGNPQDPGVPRRACACQDRGVFERSLEHPARFDETATRAVGYAGGDRYVDVPTVIDGDLITGGPKSPVQFARGFTFEEAVVGEVGGRPVAGTVARRSR